MWFGGWSKPLSCGRPSRVCSQYYSCRIWFYWFLFDYSCKAPAPSCQNMAAWPAAWILCCRASSLARLRNPRCFSAQVSQRVWPGIAAFGQALQRPSSLVWRRCSWARSLFCSLRSGVLPLATSYAFWRCAFSSGLRVVLREVVFGLGLGCFRALGLGWLVRVVLTLLFLLFGFRRSIVCWKV